MLYDVTISNGREADARSLILEADQHLSIGREAGCSIVLQNDVVSRTHAVIRLLDDGLDVEDCSTNGTVAGGELLQCASLEVPFGTPLVVGEHTVTVKPSQGAGAEVSEVPAPAVAPKLEASLIVADEPTPNGPQPGVGVNHLSGKPPRLQAAGAKGRGASGAASAKESSEDCPAPQPAALVIDDNYINLRREIHRRLIENFDLASVEAGKIDSPQFRPKVLTALRRIVGSLEHRLPPGLSKAVLIGELADEALGLGPLEQLLADPAVTEIMVLNAHKIYVERFGKLQLSEVRFTDEARVGAVIERIITPLGRRIDESSPLVDARLKDGSRVNAIIKPLALNGSCITIRKFSKSPLTMNQLIEFGSVDERMSRFLHRSVVARKNIVVSGGTGSGKTTLLNVLSSAIPDDERIVTIEDAAELRLDQPHIVSLETRPANMEGKGQYTIRDLVKNALRMRPDRIVVGECRGPEALDMLQAMNTGHDGSLTTTHANSPQEAIRRLETLVLMAGVDLPSKAIREQLATSIHLIVQQTRLGDGSRKIVNISEVAGLDRDGQIALRPIFQFKPRRSSPAVGGEAERVDGKFAATGYLPSYLDQFVRMGLIAPGERYL